MKSILTICVCFAVSCLHAQIGDVKVIDIYGGLGFTRPTGVNKTISFQGGTSVILGGQINFLFKNKYSLFVDLNTSYDVINIEGYFKEEENEDQFVVTNDNVKVNSLTFIPISGGFGIKKHSAKYTLGLMVNCFFNNKIKRWYKVGTQSYEDIYSVQDKFKIGMSGFFGLYLSKKTSSKVDFIFSYYLGSLSDNTTFKPFKIGLVLTRGFGNSINK